MCAGVMNKLLPSTYRLPHFGEFGFRDLNVHIEDIDDWLVRATRKKLLESARHKESS